MLLKSHYDRSSNSRPHSQNEVPSQPQSELCGEPPGQLIRILVADDHEYLRLGLRALIKTEPRFELCAEATDGQEAVEKAQDFKPDVVVLDVSMPGLNGIEATRQIKKRVPATEVLILTVYDSEQLITELLHAGAGGYLLKSDAAKELLIAIDSLHQRKPFFTTKVARIVLFGYLQGAATQSPSLLTARERQIVQLLAEGKTNKDVAAIQSITVKTAETHRANLMRKLGAHSIADVVHYAVRNRIIEA
jgi:DNA-binding NarL/FixJ family response regulator